MIKIKTKEDIEIMHEGGKILAKILDQLKKNVRSGIATQELDKLAHELVLKFGAKPAFLNYKGFPATICISVNEEIVHGVPSERKLKKGDVLKLDMGVIFEDFYTDSAVTVLVGGGVSLDKKILLNKKLIKVTKESLEVGIKQAKIGNTLGDVGSAIQEYVEKNKFSLIRDLVGHGIGRNLHEEPEVPNYGKPGTGPKIVEGMVIAIEPMVVTGDYEIVDGPGGFAYCTKDGSMAAHFEHTVAITKAGPLVLTR
jgi:methionyl aminopeptidase